MNRISQIGVVTLSALTLHSKSVLAQSDTKDLPQSGEFCDLPPETLMKAQFLLLLGSVQAGDDNGIAAQSRDGRLLIPNANGDYEIYQMLEPAFVRADGKIPSVGLRYDSGGETDSFYSGGYVRKLTIGSQEYLVVEERIADPLEVCPLREETRENVSTTLKEDVPHAPHGNVPALRAALLAGLEIDELVDPGFGLSAEVATMLTVRPFSDQFSAGFMADIIISSRGSGFEGVNGMVGSQGNTLGIYGIAGLGFEPRWDRIDDPTTPKIEQDPFDGVLAAGALVMVDLPLKGPLWATCGVSGELLWGGGNFPLNVGVLCGGTFGFNLQKGEPSAESTAALGS